jgi:hypothetical protein
MTLLLILFLNFGAVPGVAADHVDTKKPTKVKFHQHWDRR